MIIIIGVIIYIVGFIVAYYMLRHGFTEYRTWEHVKQDCKLATWSWLIVIVGLIFEGIIILKEKLPKINILPKDPPKWLILILLVGSISSCTFPQEGDTINTIKLYNNPTLCYFDLKEHDYGFYAPCNTYNIGDKVHFTKDTTKH